MPEFHIQSNSNNRAQEEGMASSPPGFTPHLMIQQQSVPPIPSNEVAGMQNNGVPHSAPQMMPSYMYYNPYPWMGGLPQQQFTPPQFPQLGVQMPTSSIIPPVADQNAMTLPMNGQVPMFSPMDYQMMMMGAHMGGGMPMMPMMMGGQIPFLHYNMFMSSMLHANPSMHTQMGAMAFPGNAPTPASVPITDQHTNCHPSSTQVSQEDDKSAVNCNKPAKTEAFSTVQLLNTPHTPVPLHSQREVKKEPVDLEDDLVPSPIPDEFPGTPTSPDHRSTVDHDAHDMPSQTLLMGQGDASAVPSSGASSLEHLVEYDEYLSNETVDNREEELSVAASSPHSDKHSFVENSPRISTTPDRLMIVESTENVISSSGVNVKQEESNEAKSPIEGRNEKTKQLDGGRSDMKIDENERKNKSQETSESNEPLTGHRNRSPTRPPSVPPRFPKPMKESGRWEERKSNTTGDSSRKGTWTPLRSIGDEIVESSRREKRSVVDKKSELRSEKRSESKDEERSHRGVRIPNTDKSTKQSDDTNKLNLSLERWAPCRGQKIILTAGPIPEECSVSSVVNYFKGPQCQVLDVFDVPFSSPRHRQHEYLILQFDKHRQATKVLEAKEHRVQGHVIPVSPPFDVHVKLYEITHVEKELVAILQKQCGIIVNRPSIISNHDRTYHYAYVTFGRPQDGEYAIYINEFFLTRRDYFLVIQANKNYAYTQFENVWEAKKEEERKMADKRKAIVLGEGKRRRRDTWDSMDDDEELLCSPIKKKKEVKIQSVHFKL